MTPCSNCRTTASHTNTVGCCTGCGRAFSGIGAFDAHQVGPRDERGRLTCLDPETAVSGKGVPLFAPRRRRAGEPPVWGSYSDPAERERWLSKVRAS